MADVIVPPGTVDLATVDPGSGTDPHSWFFYEGTKEITAGTNFSARAAQTKFYFGEHAAPRFTATLRCGISSAIEIHSKSGLLNLQADDSGTNTIAALKLFGGMKIIDAGGGTWTDVEANSGEISVHESTIITNWYQRGGSHSIGYNTTGITTLKVSGGSLICRRKIADDVRAYIGGNAYVEFRRAQMVASPGITAGGTSGELHITDKAYVKWCGTTIDAVYLDSDDAFFDWYDIPGNATITLVEGSAKAIARCGLRQGGVNTTRNGSTLTATTVTPRGGKPEQYQEMSPPIIRM